MDRIRTAFENLFTPTPVNGMTPWLLSPQSFVVYLFIAAITVLSPIYLRNLQLATLTAPLVFSSSDIIQLVNKSRGAAGLPPLKTSVVLDQVAVDKAADMLANRYFAHISPQAKTPWDFLSARNYRYAAAGENLALDYSTAQEAHDGFMNSASHRANILGRAYTELGVAVTQGDFEGRPAILVVQFFGRPRAATQAIARANASESAPPKPAPLTRPAPIVQATSASAIPSLRTSSIGTAPTSRAAIEASAGAETTSVATAATQTARRMRLARTKLIGIAEPLAQSAAAGVLALIGVALAFLAFRTGKITQPVAIRTLLVLVVFGYILAAPTGDIPVAEITPAAFSAPPSGV